jgi:hypothetical protein
MPNNTTSDTPTADDPIRELLEQILKRLGALEDDRKRETRPILDLILKEMTGVHDELAGIKKELRSINTRLLAFADENKRIQGEQIDQSRRLDELERRRA